MSKRKKKKLQEPFYMLTVKIVNSGSWRKLSVYAKVAFIHIAIKYQGNNKRDLSLTYKEAKQLMSEHRFNKSIDELVKFGFIDIIRSGGIWRKCNIYGLSERWRLYGTDKFIAGKRSVVSSDFNPVSITSHWCNCHFQLHLVQCMYCTACSE